MFHAPHFNRLGKRGTCISLLLSFSVFLAFATEMHFPTRWEFNKLFGYDFSTEFKCLQRVATNAAVTGKKNLAK